MWIFSESSGRLVNLDFAQSIDIYQSREMTDEEAPFIVSAFFTNGGYRIVAFPTMEEAEVWLAHLCDRLNMQGGKCNDGH